MAFVVVTRLRVRSVWHLPRFFFHASRSRMQAMKAPGNLRVETGNEPGLVFWTVTAWKDAASMRAFMLSGAHKKAMPVLNDIVDEAAVTHWEQESAELPAWRDAYQKLCDAPRFTKIKHPSADHAAGRVGRKAD